MSDTVKFFLYFFFSMIAAGVIRYAVSTSLAILRPYKEGIIREHTERSASALWDYRVSIVVAWAVGIFLHSELGYFCTVVYVLSYFATGLILARREDKISESECLADRHLMKW